MRMSIKDIAIQEFNRTASGLLKENGHFDLQAMAGNDSVVYYIDSNSLYRTNNAKSVSVAKVKEGGKLEYISFSDKYAYLFDEAGIAFSRMNSNNSIRLNEIEFTIASSNAQFPLIIEHIVLQSFNYDSFGCCGRYLGCSNAKKCIHDDIFYATAACQYKKHLDKGEIFYGENKTI